MGKIAVIGSCSTDFTVQSSQIPAQGETVLGEHLSIDFGGKGANQAIAAARLGGNVKMIGAVGDDDFGQKILTNFKRHHIDISDMQMVPGPSGSAHITLYDNDNRIIVVPSANHHITFPSEAALEKQLQDVDFVVLQQEINLNINEQVIHYCAVHEIPVLLNPAPATQLDPELIHQVTYLTPNEAERELIFPNQTLSESLAAHPNKLIVTLGDQGAIYHNGMTECFIPSFKTQPLDTTGAGDTFNGALVVGLINGLSLADAIKQANLAASLSVQKLGAQGGIPTLEELQAAEAQL